MRKNIALLLLMVLGGHVKSQSIFSALQLNDQREYKTKPPKKLLETDSFYNSGSQRVEKNIKIFDEAGMLLTEERFDEKGILQVRLTYENDTVNRVKLSRILERWNHLGYLKETAFYIYDANFFLIGITDKAANGNIMRQASLICNEKGHPIELALFDGDGNAFGKELATYFYDKNRVLTAVESNEGIVLFSDTIKISFNTASKFPGENEVYNSNGDLTHWISRSFNGTETIYEKEYRYDEFGNCTEIKIYTVKIKGNGKRKRKIDRVLKREYTY